MSTHLDLEPLWSTAEIAAWSGLALGTVKNWSTKRGLAAGKLPPPIRLGTATRWRASDVVNHFKAAA